MAREVVPAGGLLDPVEPLGVERPRARDRLGDAQALVVVDHQAHAVADRRADGAHGLQVVLERAAADLELDRAEAAAQRLLGLGRRARRAHRAQARVGRNGLQRAAQQDHERHPLGARPRIPQRHVDPAERDADEPLRPEQAEVPPEQLADVGGVGVAAGEQPADVVDQLRQRVERHARVAAHVRAPDGSFLARQLDQHERRRAQNTAGRFHRPLQLELDRPYSDFPHRQHGSIIARCPG